MQVTLFVWLNANIGKISTKNKFENYGFFLHNTIVYAQIEKKVPTIIHVTGQHYLFSEIKYDCFCHTFFFPKLFNHQKKLYDI